MMSGNEGIRGVDTIWESSNMAKKFEMIFLDHAADRNWVGAFEDVYSCLISFFSFSSSWLDCLNVYLFIFVC